VRTVEIFFKTFTIIYRIQYIIFMIIDNYELIKEPFMHEKFERVGLKKPPHR